MLRIVEVVFGGPRTGDKRARRRLARCVDSGTSSSSSVRHCNKDASHGSRRARMAARDRGRQRQTEQDQGAGSFPLLGVWVGSVVVCGVVMMAWNQGP